MYEVRYHVRVTVAKPPTQGWNGVERPGRVKLPSGRPVEQETEPEGSLNIWV
jgi:hypothetical protein